MSTIEGVAAVRVSSSKQGLQGDSLDQQLEQISAKAKQLSLVIGSEIKLVKVFEFTESASGAFDTQPIQEAIDFVKNHHVQYFFIKSIDRFTRAGSTIYGQLKIQLSRLDIQLVDCYGVINNQKVNTLEHLGVKYSWSEMAPSWTNELLEAERGKSEVRDILTRLIGSQINYIRQGYRVRPAPMGYQNKKVETEHGKRVILEPNPAESPWFIRMFELRAQGTLTDNEITKRINALGFKSRMTKKHDPTDNTKVIGHAGEKPLKLKQLQRYIANPVYAGINCEKWMNGKPIKMRFDGLVSIDLWNKANQGKLTIIEEKDTNSVFIMKGKSRAWVPKKDNPHFPYKRVVMCPLCKFPFWGSFARGRHGERHPYYHCNRNHPYLGIRAGDVHQTIREFIQDVEFTQEMFEKLRDKILSKFEERRSNLNNDSLVSLKNIEQLRMDKQMLIDKIKVLNSTAVIHALEEEVEKKNVEIDQQLAETKKIHKEEVSAQEIIRTLWYFLEHFDELLLGGANPAKDAAMFSLLFMESPTYQDLISRTPILAPIFKLKDGVQSSKSTVCERF